MALARHLPAPGSERSSPEHRLWPRRRLADRLRRPGALLWSGRRRDRRIGRLRRDARIATLHWLSDAGDPADLSGQSLRAGARPHAVRGSRDAAGPQFDRSRRPARVLRQCELHPDLPDPGKVRRDSAPLPGREEWRGDPCTDDGHAGRGGFRRARHRDSLQAVGRQRRHRPPARSSCSPHMRSRFPDFC